MTRKVTKDGGKVRREEKEKERQGRRREDSKDTAITAENGGHSISRCKLKDEEMNKKRSGGSAADSLESTPSFREDSSRTRGLEALEKCGGWRTLCMVNKFELLMKLCDDEDEEDWDVHHDDPKESPDTWTVVKRNSKSGRKSKPKPADEMDDKERTLLLTQMFPHQTTHFFAQRSPTHRVQHRNTELLSVDESCDNPDEILTITVDSGAAENVMGQHMAPGTAIKPSVGSRCGVQYTTADGSSIPNRGEKEVKVVTGEKQKCVLRMQVTDVTKALMSVSSICDAGHRVVFDRAGGYIEHEATKTRTIKKRGWCVPNEGDAR